MTRPVELPSNAVAVGEFVILNFPSGKAAVTLVGLKEMIYKELDPSSRADVQRYLTEWGDSGLYWLWDRETGNASRWANVDPKAEAAANLAVAAEAFRKFGGDPAQIVE